MGSPSRRGRKTSQSTGLNTLLALSFDPKVFWKYLFSPLIVQGAEITLLLAVISQATGIILGLFGALGRLSPGRLPVIRWLVALYLWLFRGTPLLVQLVFVYFALPQITNHAIILSEFWSAFVALSLNEGAYMTEIVRAGISSVDAGQMEAAQSLGMTRSLAMRRIVIPQAIRIILPPTGNEFISMLKNTSLAYVISVHELFYNEQLLQSATFRAFELLSIISLYYLAMTTVGSIFQGFLERHYARGFTRDLRQPGTMQRLMVGALRRA